MAGLPTRASGSDAGKPVDPSKAAAQAQRLSLPERIALPATLAGTMNQQRALNELNDKSRPSAAVQGVIGPESRLTLIPAKDGFVELSVKLLEARMVARSAMKGGSGKPALEGNVTAGNSMEAANDMLNEMQRSNGGDVVQEDHSRYQVTLRRPGSDAVWTGEVIGPPKLYPLDTINVLAAEKLIIVFDKANKKLWQSSLAYNLAGDFSELDEESATFGQGPCVERKDSLYVFDAGVLSAFDVPTGNARWRLPTVGVAGLFFDSRGMMYVNTTTASHDSLKYSRQIDLSRKVISVILKVDPRNGKILWSQDSEGLVNYISGKFILTAQSYMPEEREDDNQVDTGFERGPWLRIRRLNPNNGREVWEHYQDRAPLDIAFDNNTIRLVFKKEVQVLRFPSF
jgi:outer membrane protein assembly factor BamB